MRETSCQPGTIKRSREKEDEKEGIKVVRWREMEEEGAEK